MAKHSGDKFRISFPVHSLSFSTESPVKSVCRRRNGNNSSGCTVFIIYSFGSLYAFPMYQSFGYVTGYLVNPLQHLTWFDLFVGYVKPAKSM